MNEDILRTLIREKLADGRLPQNRMPPVWSAVGGNETCGACDLSIKSRFVMARIEGSNATQLHVRCFCAIALVGELRAIIERRLNARRLDGSLIWIGAAPELGERVLL
jgi:hypothetical protein